MNTIVLCPGFHPAQFTLDFLAFLQTDAIAASCLSFPVDRYPAYSAVDIVRFVHERLSTRSPEAWLQTPLIFIGFSAGAAGAVGAAWMIEQLGGTVRALFALDGWGVPLLGRFPSHRLSHDYLTHWSSAVLGAGLDSFYADPPVEHLDLWRPPQTVHGRWVSASQRPSHVSAAQFLSHWLQYYEQGNQ